MQGDFLEQPTRDNTPKIRVVVRKRPLNKKETQKNDLDVIETRGPQTVIVKELKQKVDLTKYIEEHNFTFDDAFDDNINNEGLYDRCVRPLIHALFNKAKVTCFAYGQTGSGKTYTMMGDSAEGQTRNSGTHVPGLYVLAAQDIFQLVEKANFQSLDVHISFYEIYCGKLYDLLNDRQQLFAREDAKQNVNIVGLQEKKVVSVNQIMQIIEYGNSVRVTGVTGANMDSSRSHAILQIALKEGTKLYGKMSFIDLAGSERGADVVDTNKQTRLDGAEINKSLLALKECIRALDQDKRHTPFRGSKLTLVLKDSFVGNCKTVMIGNISPSSASCEHTLNTLRYADRVKELKRVPNAGDDPRLSSLDMLAKQLMLPRQDKNVMRYNINQEGQQVPTSQNKGKGPSSQNFDNMGQDEPGLFDNALSQPQQGQKKPKPSSGQRSNAKIPSQKLASGPGNNNAMGLYSDNRQDQGGFNMNDGNNAFLNYKKNYDVVNNPMLQTQANKQNEIDMNFEHMTKEDILGWKAGSEEDLHKMSQKHEQLIGLILSEEEEVIGLHRQHIDDMVELVKQEMMLLHEVDKPGSDVDEYVDSLDAILAHKMEIISLLRGRLHNFKDHLKEEELLSKKFYEQRAEVLDVFDLNEREGGNNDDQLLDNLPHDSSAKN